MFTAERTSFVRPPALQPGDQIGIVAPASNIKSEMLDAGCRELERLGFRTLYRPDIVTSHRYFSGTDERRAGELLEMVRNPDVKAIFCARGGYGSGRLIPIWNRNFFLLIPRSFWVRAILRCCCLFSTGMDWSVFMDRWSLLQCVWGSKVMTGASWFEC
jgi:Uncharacterized proteins, homologs of microcin C7 resistance protein MccF